MVWNEKRFGNFSRISPMSNKHSFPSAPTRGTKEQERVNAVPEVLLFLDFYSDTSETHRREYGTQIDPDGCAFKKKKGLVRRFVLLRFRTRLAQGDRRESDPTSDGTASFFGLDRASMKRRNRVLLCARSA